MADSDLQLIVIGKTGNGKSSLCNAILGRDAFETGRSMATTTKAVQEESTRATYDGRTIQVKVVDTPDVSDPSYSGPEQEIKSWRERADSAGRTAVLLAVRCDVRFTPEEYAIYHQIKMTWGKNRFKKHLMIVFTFGDRLDGSLDEELNSKEIGPHLKKLKRQAKLGYVQFNSKSTDREQVDCLVKQAMSGKGGGGPPVCGSKKVSPKKTDKKSKQASGDDPKGTGQNAEN